MKIIMNLGNQAFSTSTILQEKINKGKNEMFELAQIFGLNHELTVAKSQELDGLINEWMTGQSY